MLHAPISETKAATTQGKSQLAPQSGRELHPHSFGATDSYALNGAINVAPVHSPGAQRDQKLKGMQSTHGNQAVLRMMHSLPQVARIPALRSSQGVTLQRKCACGGSSEAEGECAECKEKREGTLQQRAVNANAAPVGAQGAPSIVHDVLRSPGQPLDACTRDFMEPRFGHDFSQVRVHTDAKAAESARAVNALAYTVSKDVVFGSGQYAPGTSEGRKLMAHELTHVMQQREGQVQTKPGLNQYSAPHEREADMIAQSIMDRPTEQRSMLQVMPHISQIQRQTISDDTDVDNSDIEEDDGLIHDGDRPVSGMEVSYLSPGEQQAPEELTETQASFPTEVEGERGTTPTTTGAGPSTPTPTQAQGVPQEKPFITQIDVFLSPRRQHLIAHWSNGHEDNHVVSSGRGRCGTKDNPCDEKGTQMGCTPVGDWIISEQRGADAKNNENAPMAWFVGFDPTLPGRSGLGIHNSQEADGTPRSHGCVRVGKGDSKSEPWQFARKINQGVVRNKTKVHVEGKANTHPYPCPQKGKKK